MKQVGDIYYLTGNISHYTIAIRRENITLDGQGFTFLGNTTMAGVGITVFANNVTVRNFVIKTFPVGIEPSRSSGSTIPKGKGVNIINNTISNCNAAVALVYEANNSISGNVLKDNENFGIHIRQGYGNTIDGNIIFNNTEGIDIEDASQNMISNNNIAENQNGAYLHDAQANMFTENNFTHNNYGVTLINSNYNQFYLNNFFNNPTQVEIFNSLHNSWNNTSVGNYWSNYHGEDVDNNGLADTPYIISENNTDQHPLMQLFSDTFRLPEEEETFDLTLFLMVIVFAVAGSAGLVIYFKKRKH